jgi:hypothetical protein
MRTIYTLLFLFIISIQANASGYTHNMFVAHKKLQTVTVVQALSDNLSDEVTVESKLTLKVQPELSIADKITDQMAGFSTLNQRILNESRITFFDSEEEESTGNTLIGVFVNSLQKMIKTFLGIRS